MDHHATATTVEWIARMLTEQGPIETSRAVGVLRDREIITRDEYEMMIDHIRSNIGLENRDRF